MIIYDSQVNIKFKKSQFNKLQERANRYHLPVSSFIRMELFKDEEL